MKEHFILEETYFTNEGIVYECEYLEGCLYNFKMTLNFHFIIQNSNISRL